MSRKTILKYFLESNGVNTDSRTIVKNEIFFALKGDNFNGNIYAPKALEQGASFAIVDDEQFFLNDVKYILVTDVLVALQQLAIDYRDELKIPVIGITGSNGKTTTKELCNAVLTTKYKVHATKGNFNNQIGVPLTILSAPKNTELMIVEMGASYKGEIKELCKIAKPTHGLITNISSAHLEGFGNFETIVETKMALYKFLTTNGGTIFVNGEDDLLKKQFEEKNDCIIYYPNENLTLIASNPCTSWSYNIDKLKKQFDTNMVGAYNKPNIIAAITIGNYFNVSINKIFSALSNYIPSNNRSQLKIIGSNKYILDAYNANPESMRKSILNLLLLEDKNKILILGDMLELGSIELESHQDIIKLIASHHWHDVYLVGDRFMNTTHDKDIKTFKDVELLKSYLIDSPIENALVLLKGSRGIGLEKLLEI